MKERLEFNIGDCIILEKDEDSVVGYVRKVADQKVLLSQSNPYNGGLYCSKDGRWYDIEKFDRYKIIRKIDKKGVSKDVGGRILKLFSSERVYSVEELVKRLGVGEDIVDMAILELFNQSKVNFDWEWNVKTVKG